MRELTIPISPETIRELKIGDPVLVTGVMVTGRDTAHKWLEETFIKKSRPPQGDDLAIYEDLKRILAGSMIYHCGPVVSGLDTKNYKFVAAGPTTSIREEPFQADVMRHFGLRAVIGKGGMGPKTLEGCRQSPGVYLHAIGGAASLIAQTVKKVLGVYKYEFGVPESIWVIEVEKFPAVVTMDAHGRSQHEAIFESSKKVLEELLKKD
jgi:fumarate hydratase class I